MKPVAPVISSRIAVWVCRLFMRCKARVSLQTSRHARARRRGCRRPPAPCRACKMTRQRALRCRQLFAHAAVGPLQVLRHFHCCHLECTPAGMRARGQFGATHDDVFEFHGHLMFDCVTDLGEQSGRVGNARADVIVQFLTAQDLRIAGAMIAQQRAHAAGVDAGRLRTQRLRLERSEVLDFATRERQPRRIDGARCTRELSQQHFERARGIGSRRRKANPDEAHETRHAVRGPMIDEARFLAEAQLGLPLRSRRTARARSSRKLTSEGDNCSVG